MTTWLHHPEPAAACTVIAEIAQAHDGSLGTAHAMIDAAAVAGADAVKFQTHIATAESSPDEPWRVRFSPQDETRFDYWRRMEFSEAEWAGLRDHAHEKGLLFLSSPFSMEAFYLLKRIQVAGWKVASGEITNVQMLDAMCATGKPLLLSTGMSALEEIDRAVDRIKATGVPFAVLQCSSTYPTAAADVGLNVLGDFKRRYATAVGLSDHTATVYPGICAAYLGAQVIEVHLTLSKHAFGPDVAASLTVEELTRLVEGVRFAEDMRRDGVDKTAVLDEAGELRPIFMKSLVAARDLAAGETLSPTTLACRKPGTGIAATRFDEFVGRRLARPLKKHAPLAPEDVEQES
ncbi:MAG: N-acetylneuraminate synthase family protein [Geminicoccaceae bacterium]